VIAAIATLAVASAVVSCGGPTYTTYGTPSPSATPRGAGVLAELLASRDLDGRVVGDDGGPPGTASAPTTRATVVVVFASWCPHCHDEIAILSALRASHPALRVIGVNYRGHEEYDARGDAQAVRNYVHNLAPWLRTVPIGDDVFDELGRPPKIPTLYVYDARGALVEVYDRSVREMPGAGELDQLFVRLGA